MKLRAAIKFIICAVCVFSVLFSTSFAENEGTGEYLYKLKELPEYPVAFLSDARLQSDETLAGKLGIYKTDDLEMLKEFEEMGILEFYEENAVAYLFDMPNTDELKSILAPNAVLLGNSYDQILVNELWKLGLTGRGVRVAVLDSGVSANSHLAVNLSEGYNYANDDTDVTDTHGHGTLVAGLIAGNSDAYKGIAYEAEIVPLRVFVGKKAPLDIIAKGFYDAVFKYDCDVINMSFGVRKDNVNSEGSPTLRAVMDEIYRYEENQDVVIVAASGNVSPSSSGIVGKEDPYMYPASYDGVISVGNIKSDDTLWNASYENDKVDVVAPGTNLTLLSHTDLSGYTVGTGTSFSCPIVTGVVALIKQVYPELTYSEIESIIRYTATDLGDDGFDISYGYGKVDCEVIAYVLFDEIFDEMMYLSPVVQHKGTYNITIRNGLYDFYEASAFISGYDSGKMMSVLKYDINIPYGESYCMSFREMQPEMKMFFLDKNGLMPLARVIKLREPETTQQLTLQNGD